MISIIVAVAHNGVIGGSGNLLWHISEDLRRFKSITDRHTVIMGRKTFESIGRALPGRENIVITRNPSFKAEGCTVVSSLDEALSVCSPDSEVFVIGGGDIYRQALPVSDRLYLTLVDADFEGDTHFEWNPDEWQTTFEEYHPRGEKFAHPFTFVNLSRK